CLSYCPARGPPGLEPEARASRLREAAVPGGRAERVGGQQLEARVGGIDRVLGRVPRDVFVGVVVLRHRLLRQALEQRPVRGVVARGALLGGQLEAGGREVGRRHRASPPGAPPASAKARRRAPITSRMVVRRSSNSRATSLGRGSTSWAATAASRKARAMRATSSASGRAAPIES